MKLRKLILNAKFKEIEKQNQNILVFHCNLTATDWRRLKNLLSHNNLSENQKSTFVHSISKNVSLENTKKHPNFRILFLSKSSSQCMENPNITAKEYRSKQIKYQKSSILNIQDFCSKQSSAIIRTVKKSNQTQIQLTGCLFFFNPQSKDLFENSNEKSRLNSTELMKRLESSDFNNNLLLLYGQMNNIPLNHLDLKRALQLDPQETYQQLLFSIQLLSASLNSLLYQSINDFIQIQQRFPSNSSQCTKINPDLTKQNRGE